MFKEVITPRFSETDALGHINNTALPIWFEAARLPVFKIFTPELNLQAWPLILARIEVDFSGQLYYGEDIEIRTFISRIGGSSFDVTQQAWQRDSLCATGKAVMVNFCYEKQKSEVISEQLKTQLEQHLLL